MKQRLLWVFLDLYMYMCYWSIYIYFHAYDKYTCMYMYPNFGGMNSQKKLIGQKNMFVSCYQGNKCRKVSQIFLKTKFTTLYLDSYLIVRKFYILFLLFTSEKQWDSNYSNKQYDVNNMLYLTKYNVMEIYTLYPDYGALGTETFQ